MNIKYRISQTTINSFNEFNWINNQITIGRIGSFDDREIIRLIDNTHFDHIKKLLEFINKYGETSCEIGKKIITCNDSYNLSRYLAELYLFVYLYELHGDSVQPVDLSNERLPDLTIKLNDLEYKIEVYTPGDFYSYEVFKRYLITLLKYLPIDIGFDITIRVTSDNLYHPNYFPLFRAVEVWLTSFQDEIIKWIKNAKKYDTFTANGPLSGVQINIEVRELYDSWEIREIIVHGATNSVSTRLFFERVDDNIIPTHAWGIKIKDKFIKQQAGPPNSGSIRILIVNFILTDISCKLFDTQKYFQNFEKIIRYHAQEINPYPPFDIVIPSDLDYTCRFSKPIIFENSKQYILNEHLSQIGLQNI